MELKLHNESHRFLDTMVEEAATRAGCYARVKWVEPSQCRFTLHPAPMRGDYATDAQHDDTIAELFMNWPDATIRTARATYEGAASFEAQRKARVL